MSWMLGRDHLHVMAYVILWVSCMCVAEHHVKRHNARSKCLGAELLLDLTWLKSGACSATVKAGQRQRRETMTASPHNRLRSSA